MSAYVVCRKHPESPGVPQAHPSQSDEDERKAAVAERVKWFQAHGKCGLAGNQYDVVHR